MSRYYWVGHTRVKGDSCNNLRRSNVRLEPVCLLNQVAWHNDLKIGRNFCIHVLTIFKVKIMKTTTLKKRFGNVMVITNSKLCEVCCCYSVFSWITDHLGRYSKHSTVSKSISLHVDNHFELSLLLSSGSRLKQSIFILTVYYFSVSRYRLIHSFS